MQQIDSLKGAPAPGAFNLSTSDCTPVRRPKGSRVACATRRKGEGFQAREVARRYVVECVEARSEFPAFWHAVKGSMALERPHVGRKETEADGATPVAVIDRAASFVYRRSGKYRLRGGLFDALCLDLASVAEIVGVGNTAAVLGGFYRFR